MLLVIALAFLNKQTEGVILSNHSPRQVASDKWYIVTWDPVLNLKTKVEKFKEIMRVKVIIERIIKALLRSIIIYSFELIMEV